MIYKQVGFPEPEVRIKRLEAHVVRQAHIIANYRRVFEETRLPRKVYKPAKRRLHGSTNLFAVLEIVVAITLEAAFKLVELFARAVVVATLWLLAKLARAFEVHVLGRRVSLDVKAKAVQIANGTQQARGHRNLA